MMIIDDEQTGDLLWDSANKERDIYFQVEGKVPVEASFILELNWQFSSRIIASRQHHNVSST